MRDGGYEESERPDRGGDLQDDPIPDRILFRQTAAAVATASGGESISS
jgi:hypothetical protein